MIKLRAFYAETFDAIETEAVNQGINRDPSTGLRFISSNEEAEVHNFAKIRDLHLSLQEKDPSYATKVATEFPKLKNKLGSSEAATENLLRDRLNRSPTPVSND